MNPKQRYLRDYIRFLERVTDRSEWIRRQAPLPEDRLYEIIRSIEKPPMISMDDFAADVARLVELEHGIRHPNEEKT